MLKLNNDLLVELGLGALSEDQKKAMLQHIYETLELRVGTQLANQMSDQQLEEFEKFIDEGGEANQEQALQWLEANLPNYKDVVNQVFEALKGEIKQMAPQIMESSMAAAAQAPPAQQYGQMPAGVQPDMQTNAQYQGAQPAPSMAAAPPQPAPVHSPTDQPGMAAPQPMPGMQPQPGAGYAPAAPQTDFAGPAPAAGYGMPGSDPLAAAPPMQPAPNPGMPGMGAYPPAAPANYQPAQPTPQTPSYAPANPYQQPAPDAAAGYQYPPSQPPAGPGNYPPAPQQ